KEDARQAEAARVKERDAALNLEAERIKERDAALGKAGEAIKNELDAHRHRQRVQEHGKPGEAKVWDARTGMPLLNLKGPGYVWSVSYSPDGTRIVTGGAGLGHPVEAKVWDARTGNSLLDLKGHTDDVRSVSFSPDGTRIVTGSADQTAKVWDAR